MSTTHVESLSYANDRLAFGGVYLDELASRHGTPLYVYNFDLVTRRAKQLTEGIGSRPHLICYAAKANTSLALLKHIASLGLGADVVSGGELLLALKAGIPAKKIVFSGVAKTAEEINLGVQEGILCFNVESPGEIRKIAASAKNHNVVTHITLRINPDIDAKTHPKIATGLHATKFGLETSLAKEVAAKIKSEPSLILSGVSCHIGSQLLDIEPLLEAAKLLRNFAAVLRADGHRIDRIDLGGGLGVAYHPNEVAKTTTSGTYGRKMAEAMEGESATLLLEPGRSLVAESGVLLTRVIEVKKTGGKTFIMVDAGMNDLIRPSLYEAYHHIFPVWNNPNAKNSTVDIVGPVCETGDYFAIDRNMPAPKESDYLAIAHAGAYGFSMASNYNMRPRAAEIAISANQARLIRKRESVADLSRLDI